jgi:hypothetical protein
VIDTIIGKIEEKFGKMSQTRDNKHEFLGMNILFKDKKVKIEIKNIFKRQSTTLMKT